MSRLAATVLLVLVALAACQPTSPASIPPTAIPFPTVTPGRLVRGRLPTVIAPLASDSRLTNPATAVALANRPTAAPDYAACPALASPEWPPLPAAGADVTAALLRFVSDGGAASAVETGLRDEWNLLGDAGVVRGDLDFVGAGTAQLVMTYSAPGDGGTLLILGCANGRYTPFYQAVTGTLPQLVYAGDMNYDGRADLLYTSRQCSPDTPEDCAYRTMLLTWNAPEGRFVNLLNTAMSSGEPPTVNDIDNDRVLEVVARLTDDGSAVTGPLRTGVHIYDWNGQYYALSIVQLDPPRFVIQIVHEADRAFRRSELDQAISLFQLALNDPSLRYWFDDEPPLLRSYSLYRLTLLLSYTDREDEALKVVQLSLEYFPSTDGPVYTAMIDAFWNTFQTTNNLASACREVQAIITARPEAVGLLNRYGSRSPTYTADEMCPF